jgi:hypothetical protein
VEYGASSTGSTAGRTIDDLRQPAVQAAAVTQTGIIRIRQFWRSHAMVLPLSNSTRELASALVLAR